jgi:small conductance mechanosensitive channel
MMMSSMIFLLNIVIALTILLVGFFVAKYIKAIVYNILKKYDETASQFLASLVYAIFLVLVIVIALAVLGVPVSPITGVLTGIVFGVSISLKTSYNIIASGIMLTFSKPFEVGQLVDFGGTKGVVKSIGFLYTRLEAENGDDIMLANNLILSRVITTSKSQDNSLGDK